MHCISDVPGDEICGESTGPRKLFAELYRGNVGRKDVFGIVANWRQGNRKAAGPVLVRDGVLNAPENTAIGKKLQRYAADRSAADQGILQL